MSEPVDEKLESLKARLEQASDILKDVGDSAYEGGAHFVAGTIGAAMMIVDDVISWIESRNSSEEKPS